MKSDNNIIEVLMRICIVTIDDLYFLLFGSDKNQKCSNRKWVSIIVLLTFDGPPLCINN